MYYYKNKLIYDDQATGIIGANAFYLEAAEATDDPEEVFKWLSKCNFLFDTKIFQKPVDNSELL